MYIGDAATAFNSGKETAIREICRRTPSSAKPLAGLFLSATVVGKLTIPRGLNDAASDLRKATEAEQTKKSGRGIVRLDAPITAPKGKKSLAKQAITNRAVSSQYDVSAARHIGSTSVSSPFSRLPASTPTTSGVKEPDFNTLRSRLIHFIAAAARPKEVVISEFLTASRSSDSENEVRKVFDHVAQEIPGPRNSDSSRWLWDLKSESWLEVRPFAFPDYNPDQRTQASRRARISSGISSQHPVWEHFSTRVDPSALASVRAITAGGGIYPNRGKKISAKPSMPKIKTPSTSKPKVESDGDLKPRKLPPTPSTEETKVKLKSEATSTVTATTTSFSQPSLKNSRKLEDDAFSKPRATSTSVKEETHLKHSTVADGSLRKRKMIEMDVEPTSDMEEGELPSKESKKRRVTGPPEISKAEIRKKDTSVVLKRAAPVEKEAPGMSSPKQNRDHQGMKATTGLPSSRASTGKLVKPESDVKQVKDRESKSDKARVREREHEREREREKGKEKSKEKEKIREKEDGRDREGGRDRESGRDRERERERRFVEKDIVREKERRIRDRANEEETVERLKSEKSSAPIKHRRRPTPSFSSDSSEENDDPPPPKRANTVRSSIPSATSTVKSNPSKVSKPSLTALPTDKEGLRREYGAHYAQYLLITSKFYEQKAKIENVLALDTDGVSADESPDLMDSQELTELCNEYRRIRKEMENIRKALNIDFMR